MVTSTGRRASLMTALLAASCATAHEPAGTRDGGVECSAVPGSSCDAGDDCARAEIDCSSGRPACVFVGWLPDCPVGDPCGAPCATGNPCVRSVFDCTGDDLVCVETERQPAGTPCASGLACDELGVCGVCVPGVACATDSPCHDGETDCSTGAPVCVPVSRVPGTVCGVAGVCDDTGRCSECVPGAACYSNGGCTVGAVDCSTGETVCVFDRHLPAGVACSGGGRCDGSGACGG